MFEIYKQIDGEEHVIGYAQDAMEACIVIQSIAKDECEGTAYGFRHAPEDGEKGTEA